MKCAFCDMWLYELDRWRLHAEPKDRFTTFTALAARGMTPDLFFCSWRCLADYSVAQAGAKAEPEC